MTSSKDSSSPNYPSVVCPSVDSFSQDSLATQTSAPVVAIVFDVGNVLIHWNPRRAYAPLFKDREAELDYFLKEVCTLEWHTEHDRGISFYDNARALQQKFPDYAPMIARYEREWDNMFGGIIEGIVPLIRDLHDLSYPLFALTNFAADKFADFKRQNDFMALFQDIIVSGEEKIAKPDPRLYHILLKRAKIPANQMLFIDDRQENLDVAQGLGLQTHLFKDSATLRADLIAREILPEEYS